MSGPSSFFKTAVGVLDQINGQDGQLARIWHTVNPWVMGFVSRAATKWLPILANEAPCQIATPDGKGGWVLCPHPAVSFCDCCGKPTCLHHGRVDANADVICFPCVAVAHAVGRAKRAAKGSYTPPNTQGSKREAKPPPEQKMSQAAALRILGLPDGATPAEIKKTYKEMVRKWHPDRHPEADKATAVVRFREIQAAWNALKP